MKTIKVDFLKGDIAKFLMLDILSDIVVIGSFACESLSVPFLFR